VKQDIEDLLLYRANVYDLLRRLYLWEVPYEIFKEMIDFAQENPSAHQEYPENILLEYLSSDNNLDLKNLFLALKIEYTRLFIGPKHIPASPYSSVYLSGNKLLMQDVTIKVRKIYQAYNLERLRKYSEPDDHIGAELEFLYLLNFKMIEAARSKNNQDLQVLYKSHADFYFDHIKVWVPQFCNAIIESTDNLFWKTTAEFTMSFIEQESYNLDFIRNTLQISDEA